MRGNTTPSQKPRRPAARHAAEPLESRVLLAVFTVTNADNTGEGSLRHAIQQANTAQGPDTVRFAIPGNGPHVIRVARAVPNDPLSAPLVVTESAVIDGYSQSGASPNTLPVGNNAVIRIRIDGASAGAGVAGMFIDRTSGVSVRGLSITGFEDGVIIRDSLGDNVVAGNFIGLDPAGSPAANRGWGVSVEGSPDNIIGGASPADRNVISSNGTAGVRLSGILSTDNVVAGNYIGTDPSGTAARGNTGPGVLVGPSATGTYSQRNTIGGVEAGAGNVISGNTQNGVVLLGPTRFNAVQGNRIGTDAAGTAALPNAFHGVLITFPALGTPAASDTTIGGVVAPARNIISGNGRAGVALFGPGASNNAIQGNYIGTDATGTYAISNGNDGIRMGDTSLGAGPSGNTVGGTFPGAGNLISGNLDNGVELAGATTTNNLVAGNLIGTDRTGTSAIFNTRGVLLDSARGNRVGSFAAGARNVISGSEAAGVTVRGAGAVENQIQGNYIGTASDGASPVPNLGAGVELADQASRNVIGAALDSLVVGEGNVIAFNGGDGVAVLGGDRNTIRLNSIHSNAQLGIDLRGDEQTLNDAADGDAGPNGLANWPEIVQFSLGGGLLPRVTGYFEGAPNTTYTLDFYSNEGTSRTSLGEGGRYLSTETLTTDADGYVRFSYTVGLAAPLRHFVTATATDPAGNTSEFSHDADTDGLFDHWESGAGVDGDGDGDADYFLANPDPLHKDVYVEVDEMPGFSTNSAGQFVIFAFANFAPALSLLNPDGRGGITLHYERDPVTIPQTPITNMQQLRAVKQQEFGLPNERGLAPLLAAKRMTHRYSVFAPSDPAAGGMSWLLSHEFYQSIGPGNTRNLAAVFMHELGHALNLDHGGGDGLNYKPNYHSIMNYQWSYRHVPQSQAPLEGSFATSWRLNYSAGAFPTLDENHLVERDGVGGHPGHATQAGPMARRYVPESGPVDWNRDGDFNDVITTGIDINQTVAGTAGAGTLLHGHDDWSNLTLNFRHSAKYREEAGLAPAGGPQPSDGDLPPDEIDALADVGYANASPRVRGLLAQIVDEGARVEFTVPATDPENDPLTFALAAGAPAGARIDPATGRFTWQTDSGDGYGVYVVTVRVTDAGSGRGREHGYAIVVNDVGGVAGRHVFYNRSAFDGNDPAANAADDAAFATDKVALRPGGASSFDNVTSYVRGINGVIVDLNLPQGATPTADDFAFHAGTGGDPSKWPLLPTPPAVTVRRGAGASGSDRVTLTWPDGAVRNTWLQVTVKASERTGLAEPDVFYFGNLVGETGDAAGDAGVAGLPRPLRVTALDVLAVRRALTTSAVAVDSRHDVNRDGRVNALDIAAVRTSLNRALAPVILPIPAGIIPAAMPPRDEANPTRDVLS